MEPEIWPVRDYLECRVSTRKDLKILIKEGGNKKANVESKKEEHRDDMAMTQEEYHTNKVFVFLEMYITVQVNKSSAPA